LLILDRKTFHHIAYFRFSSRQFLVHALEHSEFLPLKRTSHLRLQLDRYLQRIKLTCYLPARHQAVEWFLRLQRRSNLPLDSQGKAAKRRFSPIVHITRQDSYPRLTRMVSNISHQYTGFLHDFTSHSFLQCFTRLKEASQSRVQCFTESFTFNMALDLRLTFRKPFLNFELSLKLYIA
jgi:hypothetical protein